MEKKRNLWVISTDKPSSVVKFFTNKFNFSKEILPIQDEERYQNIYITNDEEIKEVNIDNYTCIFISDNGLISTLAGKGYGRVKTIGNYYKIILTNDSELIADNVQDIDDEFLEWFVNNAGCEFVDVNWVKTPDGIFYHKDNVPYGCYKIIIPKKEPKQETLEEAAKEFFRKFKHTHSPDNYYLALVKFAKWQAERMYNEEEVLNILNSFAKHIIINKNDDSTIAQWFEQFKNKQS